VSAPTAASTATQPSHAAPTGSSATDAANPRRRLAQPEPLAGFGRLLRFLVRRDRVRAPVWVAAIVGVATISGASVTGLYSSPAELANYASVANANAAIKAIAGPGYGLDDPTQGAVVMNEVGLYTLIAVALMCIFLLIRHTRAEEETDRAELVRAAPVGRSATLAAALVWVTFINLAVSVGLTLGLVALGLPFSGSAAFGAACAGLGLVFTAVAAVTAQMASTARAATGGAAGALGVFFVLRAVGDMGNGWMRWLSPLGWAQAIRPYANERWWVLILLTGTAAGLVVSAVFLLAKRDLGAGFFKQRPGPAGGSPRLASPLALAVRLQRTSMISWAIGVSLAGFFFGIVADQADELLENEAVADMLSASGSGTPTESFLATIVLMLALIASGFAVSAVLRARTEEFALRVGPILASPVNRWRWLLSYLAVAAGGSVAIMVGAGLLTGIGYGVQVGDASEILPLVAASLAMVPALLVMSTLTVALIGVRPKWAPAAWAGVAFVVVVGLLSETLRLPQWTRDISPFHHVPAIPAASFEILPILMLIAVATGLGTVGLSGMQRRDIARR
jgi:ABC-2 type transport system permease protein